MLPLSSAGAASHGFEYERKGLLSLFTALSTRTREVISKTAGSHFSEQFVGFLEEVKAA